MNKSATYDDISKIIKERVDNFELKDNNLKKLLSKEEINEMLHDLTEFGMTASYITYSNNGKGFCIKQINTMDMCTAMPESIMREPSFPINVVPFYPRSYASRDTMELIDAILFQEEKQKKPKDNHPHGWYRKFEKKRY